MSVVLKGIKEEIWVKVRAEVRQDKGAVIHVPFQIKCKKPLRDEQKRVSQAIDQQEMDDEQLVREYVLEWKDLKDANDDEIMFSDENLEVLLQAPEYLAALTRGALEAITGIKAIRKN